MRLRILPTSRDPAPCGLHEAHSRNTNSPPPPGTPHWEGNRPLDPISGALYPGHQASRGPVQGSTGGICHPAESDVDARDSEKDQRRRNV